MRQESVQFTNLALKALLAEVRPQLEGAFMNNVQELPVKDSFKVKLHSSKGSLTLIITPHALFLTSFTLNAKKQSSGYSAFLKKRLTSKRVQRITQEGMDKVVRVEFDEYWLIIELFADGNLILTDTQGVILQPLHRQEWKDRSIKRGEKYKLPSSKAWDFSKASLTSFQASLKGHERSIVLSLINEYWVAPVLSEEALARAGIAKEKQANCLQEKEVKALFGILQRLYEMKEASTLTSFQERKVLALVESQQFKTERVQSVNQALDESIAKSIQESLTQEASKEQVKKTKGLEQSLSSQEQALGRLAELHAESQQKGVIITRNAALIQAIIDAVRKGKKAGLSEEAISQGIKESKAYGKASQALVQVNLKENQAMLELE